MNRRTLLIRSAIALAVLLFLAFVWPTAWEYRTAAHIWPRRESTVRINRFTGHVDVLWPGRGWIPVEDFR